MDRANPPPYGHLFTGLVIGAAVAFAWNYLLMLGYYYLALWRFTDGWPALARDSVPIVLFGVVVLAPSYVAITRLPTPVARTTMLVSTFAFIFAALYSSATGTSGISLWGIDGVLSAMVAGAAIFGWRKMDKRPRT